MLVKRTGETASHSLNQKGFDRLKRTHKSRNTRSPDTSSTARLMSACKAVAPASQDARLSHSRDERNQLAPAIVNHCRWCLLSVPAPILPPPVSAPAPCLNQAPAVAAKLPVSLFL